MKKGKKIVKLFIIMFSIITLSYFSLYLYARFLDKIKISNNNSFLMYDNKNELFNMNDNWVSINDISENLINATISIEDKNFYNHIGFDYLRIGKALLTNIQKGGNVQGASTISQQYAKNLYLKFDKTWERKIEEAWLTIRLESHYSKNDILEGYLNTINYGGVFGIDNASYYYFKKNPNELTLAEASILAGIPKSPTNYSPINNLENAKKRQKIILNAMVNNGFISKDEASNAEDEELSFIGVNKSIDSKTLMYFEDAVIDELNSLNLVGISKIKNNGLKIYTTLDVETQLNLENNLLKNIATDDKLQVSSIMVSPKNGEVLSLVGGRDYSKSQYNRALNSKRQVGSTLKPFLYYSALESGFTASTTFNSSETTFVFSNEKTYTPKNYAEVYGEKDISMGAALAYSDNVYAVKTHLFLGESNLVNALNRVGISGKLPEIPSLALGTSEISLMDMMNSYATLANLGKRSDLHFIKKITDLDDNILYEYKKEEDEFVLNESTTYILNELLSNCYNSSLIDYNYPTCINIASNLSNKYAIKTGTTDTDHLIFGFNKDAVLGIWAGYDDNKETYPNISNYIKFSFADTMETYFKDKKTKWYQTPKNVVGVLVDPITGKISKTGDKNKTIYYYIKGTEPHFKEEELDDLIPTIKTE